MHYSVLHGFWLVFADAGQYYDSICPVLISMRVPVLTYHATRVAGDEYQQNDHVALMHDLRLIHALGFQVITLEQMVGNLLGRRTERLERAVVLTCDDGCDLEVEDRHYPGVGLQSSFLNILKIAEQDLGLTYRPSMSSFVIADPQARRKMDDECLFGQQWMSDDWWYAVQAEHYLSIECHGWDHNHAILGETGFDGMSTGNFYDVDSKIRAAYQVDQALAFINQKITPQYCRHFAYPYGHVSEYLRSQYFPENAERLGLEAAFGTAPGYVGRASDRWNLPRFVSGWHWKSSEELKAILLASEQE